MSELPSEVLERIEAGEGVWSDHAQRSSIELGLSWDDVIEVARTAETWKREKDEEKKAIDGWKDAVTGRDTSGRNIYLAGKWMYYKGERCWYVLTIKKAGT